MHLEKLRLDNIGIASPCSIPWESMAGDERSRFCGSCNLNVYDFSGLSADQIRSLLIEKEGRICARLRRRADGKIITKDCPKGLRALRLRSARYAGTALAAVLSFFSIGLSQSGKKEKLNDRSKISRKSQAAAEAKISGVVTDTHGAVVPGIPIKLIAADKTVRKEISDESGAYGFDPVSPGEYTLIFEAGNWFKKTWIKNLIINANESLDITTELKPHGETVMLGIVGNNSGTNMASTGLTYTITREMLDSLPKN